MSLALVGTLTPDSGSCRIGGCVGYVPQLFNVVFKGNLSLVGPRPHATQAKAANHLYDEVVDGYFARHRVKPTPGAHR